MERLITQRDIVAPIVNGSFLNFRAKLGAGGWHAVSQLLERLQPDGLDS